MTYREKLFTLLGDRDPLEVMAQTPSTLAEIVRAHPTAVLRTRPFAGKWTPNEIIGHLADGEWVEVGANLPVPRAGVLLAHLMWGANMTVMIAMTKANAARKNRFI